MNYPLGSFGFGAAIRRVRLAYIQRTRGGTGVARAMGVKVGEGCRIYTRNFNGEPWLVTIGDRVTVTAGVSFITHDGATWLIRDDKGRRYRFAPIEVGNDVFIGLNSILLPGVKVGDRCIIGAGSVVTKSVPSGYVVAGVPARIVGLFDVYREKALATFASESDMRGATARQRIDAILHRDLAPEIPIPKHLEPAQIQ
jgi:acetyltransferase-like isoleucine patch superfamily enzyme